MSKPAETLERSERDRVTVEQEGPAAPNEPDGSETDHTFNFSQSRGRAEERNRRERAEKRKRKSKGEIRVQGAHLRLANVLYLGVRSTTKVPKQRIEATLPSRLYLLSVMAVPAGQLM